MRTVGKIIGILVSIGLVLAIIGGVLIAITYPYNGESAVAIFRNAAENRSIDVDKTLSMDNVTNIEISSHFRIELYNNDIKDENGEITAESKNELTVKDEGTFIATSNSNIEKTVEVVGNKAIVKIQKRGFAWFFSTNTATIKVAFPSTFSGDIKVENSISMLDFSRITNNFNKIDADIISGKVVGDITAKNITLEMTSGEIECGAIKAEEKLIVRTTSGRFTPKTVEAKNIALKSTSGNVGIESLACETLEVNSTSGKINLDNADILKELNIKTTSGNFNAKVLNNVKTYVKSTSGTIRISAPKTSEGCLYLDITSGKFKNENWASNITSKDITNEGEYGQLANSVCIDADITSGSLTMIGY